MLISNPAKKKKSTLNKWTTYRPATQKQLEQKVGEPLQDQQMVPHKITNIKSVQQRKEWKVSFSRARENIFADFTSVLVAFPAAVAKTDKKQLEKGRTHFEQQLRCCRPPWQGRAWPKGERQRVTLYLQLEIREWPGSGPGLGNPSVPTFSRETPAKHPTTLWNSSSSWGPRGRHFTFKPQNLTED